MREVYEVQREALYLTLPDKSYNELARCAFSWGETGCLLSLARTEDKLGNWKACIDLLLVIKQQYENSFLGLQHYARYYESICRNIGDVLGNNGQYEAGIQVEYDGIRSALKSGLESILSTMIYDCGWNMEHLWNDTYTSKESLQYIKISYYLFTLFGSEEDKRFIRDHISRVYENN